MSIDARTKQQYAKVFGDWKIGELLGQGSQGKSSVYRITKSNYTYEEVGALKVMNIVEQRGRYKQLPETLRTEYDKNCKDAKRKAENEIQLMYKLKNNKHIVRYLEHHFESWEDENGYGVDLLIRMDFYQNLGNIMAQGKVYMEDEVKKVGMDICLALIACHKERILHRDIKPDNIFRENDGNYLLGDFGVSRYTENSLEAETMTGSYPYAAPEQMGAFGVNNYDGRVDIYSLGLTLYELANGNCRPFSSSPMDKKMENIKKRLVGKKIPKPSEVSDALSEIILKACEYKPQDRYQTVNEFYQALMDITEEKKIFKPEICMEGLEKENGFNIDETIPAENGSLNIEYSDETLPAHGKYRDSDVVLEFTETGQEKSDNMLIAPIRGFSIKKMKFDSKRFMQESQERNFLMGKKAFEAEKFDEARLLFSKAYGQGNVLAGVHLGEIYYSGKGCEHNYDKAIPLFVDGMNRGCPLGAGWLAEAYRTGKGVPKDKDKAREIYDFCVEALETMCASGSASAQYFYGFDLLYGTFLSKDEQKAFYWLERAMKAGVIAAGVQVAKTYLYGWGHDKDEQKGVEILERYAGTTNNNAHFELGKVFYYGKVKEQDYKKALKHFKIAAEKGHASAQDYVGNIYYFGIGVEKNYTEAKKWYELAAEKNNVNSLCNLGLIYHFGFGVQRDYDKAFMYLRKAAELGDAFAQFKLISYYVYGLADGKYTDYKIGFYYLEKSAEQGNRDAQRELARNYLTGQYGIQDEQKFVYWMTKSAEQGDAEAQRILGEAYIRLYNEETLPKSYSEAIKWLTKAANQGDIQALILLAEIYSAGEGIEKDERKAADYLQQAESRLTDAEKNGELLHDEYKSLADFYYKLYSDKVNRQIAFDYYCKAFSDGEGKRSVTYDVGWMYFVNGYESFALNLNAEELIKIIKEEEATSDDSNLAYLLGQIYYNGYRVSDSKAEAEKWYLKAKEKGSLSAYCRLAIYYVDELQLYDKGFAILEEAYRRGSVEGTRLLGLCYKKGIGVKKSRSKAKSLLKEAVNNGDEDAAEELKKYNWQSSIFKIG